MDKVVFELPVYTFQIDFVGHVSNIVYVEWMEIGRAKLLDAMDLSIDQIAAKGIAPVLVSTQIDYREPLFLGDSVRIEVWISELRQASARIEFRFFKEGDVLVATGSQRGLFVHRDSMRPYRMTREMRERCESFMGSSVTTGLSEANGVVHADP